MNFRSPGPLAVAIAMVMVATVSAQAQQPGASASALSLPSVGWPMAPVEWQTDGITDLTREQINQVEAAVRHLDAPRLARSEGYRPALGMIPTMGEHWVNVRGMNTAFDRASPPHLMFSPINGEEQLVGAAYAFQRSPNDPVPDAFDGTADAWHEHAELGMGTQTLTMLHVWFVPSPDGPFAGHNPWLAYWAVGLEPPARADMTAQPDDYRVRAVSLALAESYGSSVGGEALARFLRIPGGPEREEEGRGRIRSLIPRLDQAQREDDLETWNRVAGQMIATWQRLNDERLAAIPLPRVREQLAAFYQEMLTGGHGSAHQDAPEVAPHVH